MVEFHANSKDLRVDGRKGVFSLKGPKVKNDAFFLFEHKLNGMYKNSTTTGIYRVDRPPGRCV